MKAENSTNISMKAPKLFKFEEFCFPDTLSYRVSSRGRPEGSLFDSDYTEV